MNCPRLDCEVDDGDGDDSVREAVVEGRFSVPRGPLRMVLKLRERDGDEACDGGKYQADALRKRSEADASLWAASTSLKS